MIGRVDRQAEIVNTYASGQVETLYSINEHGGLIGLRIDDATVLNSYYNVELSMLAGVGVGDDGGVFGLSTAEMKRENSYADWDFAEIWRIQEEVTYPHFKRGALHLAAFDPPIAYLGEAYLFQFEVGGGTPPYVFTVVDGALPAGLALDEQGRLTGVPLELGDFSFTVRLVDDAGTIDEHVFRQSVLVPPPILIGAKTNEAGTVVTLVFDKEMADPPFEDTVYLFEIFSLLADGVDLVDRELIVGLELREGDATRANLLLREPPPDTGGEYSYVHLRCEQNISVTYYAGGNPLWGGNAEIADWLSVDGGVLASFSDYPVDNRIYCEYTLAYAAESGGSLVGETAQSVPRGEDGTPVEAIPDEGFWFVMWSDEVEDNPRTDLEVLADLEATAWFSPPPPKADFTASLIGGENPFTMRFDDLSSGNPTAWAWYFGDEDYAKPWERMTPNAGWHIRSSHSLAVLPNGKILVKGGGRFISPDQGAILFNDVWLSSDRGASWRLKTETADWPARNGHAGMALADGTVLVIGGRDSQTYFADVWRSANRGRDWTLATDDPGWSARSGHSVDVLADGTLILAGGSIGTYGYLNDVWRSMDGGFTWELLTDAAAWSARSGHATVVMPNDDILLFGGGDSGGAMAYRFKNDVWRSTDGGSTWEEANAAAPWLPRIGHAAVATPDGGILLFGGLHIAEDFSAFDVFNDVWRSTDGGLNWTEVVGDSDWEPRYGHAAARLPDGSVLVAGGVDHDDMMVHYFYKNDVWRLETAGSYERHPEHAYSGAGVHDVALLVSNPGGNDALYRPRFASLALVELQAGWNPLSLPVEPFDAALSCILDPAKRVDGERREAAEEAPVAWHWQARHYRATGSLQALEGGWLHVAKDATIAVGGEAIDSLKLDLAKGWNLIGVPAAMPAPSDPRLAGDWWGYARDEGEFVVKDELLPGRAYWIYAYQPFTLPLE